MQCIIKFHVSNLRFETKKCSLALIRKHGDDREGEVGHSATELGMHVQG